MDDDEVVDELILLRDEIRRLKRKAAWFLGLPMARNDDVDRRDIGRVFNHLVDCGAASVSFTIESRGGRWRGYIMNVQELLDESTQPEDDGASVEGVEKKA